MDLTKLKIKRIVLHQAAQIGTKVADAFYLEDKAVTVNKICYDKSGLAIFVCGCGRLEGFSISIPLANIKFVEYFPKKPKAKTPEQKPEQKPEPEPELEQKAYVNLKHDADALPDELP